MNACIFTFTYRQSSSNRRGSTQACGSTWCLPQIEAQRTTHIPVKRPCSIVLHVTICCGGGWEIHHHHHAIPIKGHISMNSMCEHLLTTLHVANLCKESSNGPYSTERRSNKSLCLYTTNLTVPVRLSLQLYCVGTFHLCSTAFSVPKLPYSAPILLPHKNTIQ